MSFSVASYFICSPRASSASATSASSPTEDAPSCCHGASPLSTPLHRKTNRKPRPLLQRTAVALSQVRRAHGGRRAIHGGTTPTPFSTAPGHGSMKSLAHTPHCRRVSQRLGEVCLRCPWTTSSCPRLGSLPPSTRLCTGAPVATPAALTAPPNFNPSASLHSICIGPASAAPAASF
jgi:hypothetical protein